MLSLATIPYVAFSYIFHRICPCELITYEPDCFLNCHWREGTCQNIINCETIQDKKTCNWSDICAWDRSCIDFGRCDKHRYEDAQECSNIGCFPGIRDSNGLMICSSVRDFKSCKLFTSPVTCKGYQTDYGTCVWDYDENACIKVLDDCYSLQYYQSDVCTLYNGCIQQDGGACEYATCALLSQEECGSIMVYKFNNGLSISLLTMCSWDGTECLESDNADQWGQDDCFDKTLGTYTWDSDEQKCISCDINSSTIIMVMILQLLVYI